MPVYVHGCSILTETDRTNELRHRVNIWKLVYISMIPMNYATLIFCL